MGNCGVGDLSLPLNQELSSAGKYSGNLFEVWSFVISGQITEKVDDLLYFCLYIFWGAPSLNITSGRSRV